MVKYVAKISGELVINFIDLEFEIPSSAASEETFFEYLEGHPPLDKLLNAGDINVDVYTYEIIEERHEDTSQ